MVHKYPLLLLLSPLHVGGRPTNAARCHGSYGNWYWYWLTQPQGRPKMQNSQSAVVSVRCCFLGDIASKR